MQEDDLKIDVGEADEQETEIDLDAAPQEEQPEEKPEIEIAEAPGKTHEEAEEVKQAEPKEELSEYSESVKKRIAKLTHKMREAERQKEEAIEYAKNQKSYADKYRQRYESLDSDYTKEFEKRVTSGKEAIQTKLAAAIASGDVNAQVAAQTELAQLSMDASRLARIKEVDQKMVTPQEPQAPNPQAPRQPDPKADAWAAKNPWFGTDNAMTYTAFDIHKQLVEQEGFDGQSDEYYAEVDKRIRLEFPHKFDTNKGTTAEPVQTVASANRPAAKGRRKTVKLTPSQVAISKRLGVPLEEYAKQLAAKEV